MIAFSAHAHAGKTASSQIGCTGVPDHRGGLSQKHFAVHENDGACQRVDRRKVRVVLDVQDKKWGGGGHTQFHEMVVGLERVRKLLATDPTCARFRDYARVK